MKTNTATRCSRCDKGFPATFRAIHIRGIHEKCDRGIVSCLGCSDSVVEYAKGRDDVAFVLVENPDG